MTSTARPSRLNIRIEAGGVDADVLDLAACEAQAVFIAAGVNESDAAYAYQLRDQHGLRRQTRRDRKASHYAVTFDKAMAAARKVCCPNSENYPEDFNMIVIDLEPMPASRD
jgi:hypothetical protein